MSDFDVLILGGGSGGYAAALRAAELGSRVGLVEKDRLGGTCLHRGCIPTKALLHAAEVADTARDAAGYGVRASLDGIDMAGVNSYKNGVVARLYKGLQGLVSGRGITVLEGAGALAGAGQVRVGDQIHSAPSVVLATGSYPKTLPSLDVDGERVLTSDQALDLDRVPASVIVLGGGVIGVEFASVWRSFGAQVTVIEALPRLLSLEDPDCSKVVQRAFRKRGIDVLTGARFESVDHTEDGVTVTVAGGNQLHAEVLLVAVGRGPATDGIGYTEAGVAMERGLVVTDERLRTNLEGISAVGDIVDGPQLAHRGFAHGIFVAEQIAGLNPAPVVDATIPRVTYCDPEVAAVGLTAEQAAAEHGADRIETLSYDLGGNGKSQILKTQGFVKLVRRKDGPVLGVHIVGARASELIGEAQLICGWDAYPDEVAELIHAHPTQSEALGEAHLALAGKPLHVHG